MKEKPRDMAFWSVSQQARSRLLGLRNQQDDGATPMKSGSPDMPISIRVQADEELNWRALKAFLPVTAGTIFTELPIPDGS